MTGKRDKSMIEDENWHIRKSYMRTVLEPILVSQFGIKRLISCYPKTDKNWICKVEIEEGTDIWEVDLNRHIVILWHGGIGDAYRFTMSQESEFQGALF